LLFGKRLPEVAKSLGSSYREFRRGLSELQSQVDFSDTFDTTTSSTSYSSSSDSSYDDFDDYDESTAPKFEPPPAEPQDGHDDVGQEGKADQVPTGDIAKNVPEK
jgi:sec-independent protein translocase protein TatA